MENREINLMELGTFSTCKHRNMFEQMKLLNSIVTILANANEPLSAGEIAEFIDEPRKRYAKGAFGLPWEFERFGERTGEGMFSNCRYVIEDKVTKSVVQANIQRLIEISVVDYEIKPSIDMELFEKMFGKNTGVIVPEVKKYYLK